jgi:hypothetical protein
MRARLTASAARRAAAGGLQEAQLDADKAEIARAEKERLRQEQDRKKELIAKLKADEAQKVAQGAVRGHRIAWQRLPPAHDAPACWLAQGGRGVGAARPGLARLQPGGTRCSAGDHPRAPATRRLPLPCRRGAARTGCSSC